MPLGLCEQKQGRGTVSLLMHHQWNSAAVTTVTPGPAHSPVDRARSSAASLSASRSPWTPRPPATCSCRASNPGCPPPRGPGSLAEDWLPGEPRYWRVGSPFPQGGAWAWSGSSAPLKNTQSRLIARGQDAQLRLYSSLTLAQWCTTPVRSAAGF